MNWKLYIFWLISFLGGTVFVYMLPETSLTPPLRYLFLGVWGAVLGAFFNILLSKKAMGGSVDSFDQAIAPKKQPKTQLISIVDGKEVQSDSSAPSSVPAMRVVRAPEFPDEEWIEFTHALLHNRPFPEIVSKMNKILPKMFKNASGVLYMYNGNQSELAQIFAFGEHTISDPKIAPAECASFDSAKIIVADYAHPQSTPGCLHLHHRPQGFSFCAPIEGIGEHFGILTIQTDALPDGESADTWKTRLSMIVTAFGLFVANQNMQIRFNTESLHDQLTGLVNKRYMEEALTRAISEARRHGTPIGMIMLHPDNLDDLQGQQGKHVAEQMLWELAQRLPRYIRTEDVPCRFSDEVLCVLLPGADKIRTEQRAEKIRHEIENLQVAYGKMILQTTLSLGVASYPGNAKTGADLVTCAEQAMQQADALGKNQVCISAMSSDK